MFISQMSLPRRTFLRGLGAMLALPLLDAMVPALSALTATAGKPARRLGFVYVPNGVIHDQWVPASVGAGFELSPTLRPLDAVRNKVLVLTNLSQKQAESFGDGNGDHARGTASWLNGIHPKRTEGAGIQAGTTIDQIAAEQLGRDTRLPSLELALEAQERSLGSCDNGYACVYINTISWRTPTTPVPMEIHPRIVFDRLFGDGGNAAQRLAEVRRQHSILDSVQQEASRLQRSLGASDRTKVNEYLESVREVEQRIQRAEQQTGELTIDLPGRPTDIPENFEDHAKLMFDLQVLAYQTDLTRVITFMLGRELSGRTFPEIGVVESHHATSHHQNDPVKIANLLKIKVLHSTLFAYYLDKLAATPDGDGSLLDHMLIVYGSGMGDSNAHAPNDLAVLLAGGAAGKIRPGRHVKYKPATPLANLHLSVLDLFDVKGVDQMGDSTGRLERLADLT
jgi:Protein of unknown function (DUF1552)